MKRILVSLGTRIIVVLLGAAVVLQGVQNLRSGRVAYWNASRFFVLYPEIQISTGIIFVLLAVLPLKRIVDAITRPYLVDHKAKLHPFWRRRRHKPVSHDD